MTYSKNLSFIHDDGFGSHAINASKFIANKLKNMEGSLIIDLACGSGTMAKGLTEKGFKIYGIDISPEMIKIAKKKVPSEKFKVGSYLNETFPKCRAITVVGEGLNYLFDQKVNLMTLNKFFKKCFEALEKKGFLIFDIMESSPEIDHNRKGFRFGKDWVVLSENIENKKNKTLRRKITSFVKQGKNYQRTDEVHEVVLYRRKNIVKNLEKIGFKVQIKKSYQNSSLLPGRAVYVCKK